MNSNFIVKEKIKVFDKCNNIKNNNNIIKNDIYKIIKTKEKIRLNENRKIKKKNGINKDISSHDDNCFQGINNNVMNVMKSDNFNNNFLFGKNRKGHKSFILRCIYSRVTLYFIHSNKYNSKQNLYIENKKKFFKEKLLNKKKEKNKYLIYKANRKNKDRRIQRINKEIYISNKISISNGKSKLMSINMNNLDVVKSDVINNHLINKNLMNQHDKSIKIRGEENFEKSLYLKKDKVQDNQIKNEKEEEEKEMNTLTKKEMNNNINNELNINTMEDYNNYCKIFEINDDGSLMDSYHNHHISAIDYNKNLILDDEYIKYEGKKNKKYFIGNDIIHSPMFTLSIENKNINDSKGIFYIKKKNKYFNIFH